MHYYKFCDLNFISKENIKEWNEKFDIHNVLIYYLDITNSFEIIAK